MGLPKAGLALLYADWLEQVGIHDSKGRHKDLPGIIKKDALNIRKTLKAYFELIDPGIITTVSKAEKAMKEFRRKKVSLIILCHVMWSEDSPLIQILEELGGIPLLVWGYNPYARLPEYMTTTYLFRASGTVGLLQGSAALARTHTDFLFVFGRPASPDLKNELKAISMAVGARDKLRALKIGQLGGFCEEIRATHIDKSRFSSEIGPRVNNLNIVQFADIARKIDSKQVEKFIGGLKRKYPVKGVSAPALEAAARASLAVEKIVSREKLGAIAIEDLNKEMHALLKTRPCLCVPSLFDRGVVVGMEGDLLATTALWVLRQFGRSPVMYTEIFTYDEKENSILVGHAGMHDVQIAGRGKVEIVPDYEYEAVDETEGAWMQFMAHPGPVILVSFFESPDGFRFTAFTGKVLPGNARLMGYPHAKIKLHIPVRDFFQKLTSLGMTQHFALTYDNVIPPLKHLAQLLKAKLILL